MLKDLLKKNNAIQIQVDVETWQEALNTAAKPLLDNRVIRREYLDTIIETTKHSGAYYVFEDEMFALPHARPENGANELGFSLVTLKKPISICGSPNVDLIIMMAAIDSYSHIESGLRPIFEILGDEVVRNKIKSAQTIQEVLGLI